MSSPKQPSLLELVKRHERLLDILLYALADHASGIVSALHQCEFCESKPATVSNAENKCACDNCCARFIVKNKENPISWIDLPAADEIRRTLMHYDEATELDVVVH